MFPADIFRDFLCNIFHISIHLVQKYRRTFTEKGKICTEILAFTGDYTL
jgi:hypothetical protein